jgi:dihydrofolate reductase
MGSTTYRAMAAHWPHDTSDFATPMNDIPKLVFSASMTTPVWGGTRFIRDEISTGIAMLKNDNAPGYLLVHGGAQFARALCRTGLMDEIRLLVHPVILGEGQRIFPRPMNLTPVATTAFSGGAVAHVLRAY